jgi:hypothetical protein
VVAGDAAAPCAGGAVGDAVGEDSCAAADPKMASLILLKMLIVSSR